MTTEIKVGPPVITISQGRTFMVTDQHGFIDTNSDQGIYALDTRFVSFYQLLLNRVPWQVINSSQLTFYAARFHLTNPTIQTQSGEIEAHRLGLVVNRIVSEGIHEELEVVNYSGGKVSFVLELDLRCDFAALFEVKRRQIIQRGKQQTQWDHKAQQLRTTYDHDDFHRGLVYHITAGDSPAGYANGRIFFELELEQNTPWHVCADLLLEHGQQVKQPQPGTCSFAHQTNTASSHTDATHASQHTLSSGFDERQQRWRDRCTAISTTNNGLL